MRAEKTVTYGRFPPVKLLMGRKNIFEISFGDWNLRLMINVVVRSSRFQRSFVGVFNFHFLSILCSSLCCKW